MKERAQFLLDYKDPLYTRSDDETEMLQRAVDNNGIVSRADYETAWSNYRTCVQDHGYTDPVPNEYGSFYSLPMTVRNGLTQEQADKAQETAVYCWSVYTMDIDGLYGLNFGNPSLVGDPEQAIVDCLHKRGLADASYTSDQYIEDSQKLESERSSSVDWEATGTQECVIANGGSLSNDNESMWKPLG
ncbi:MAG: hypothetical protein PUF97_04365 [Bifidobacteriaceae bacterium]|nr:hypothetical protein [Bifidobacteriaceae bacterium]